MVKLRVPCPGINGPPYGPLLLRVSAIRQGVNGKKARALDALGALPAMKYPSMSRTRSVSLLANAVRDPLAPAGTMAAFAFVRPSTEFVVETVGCGAPVGQTVR